MHVVTYLELSPDGVARSAPLVRNHAASSRSAPGSRDHLVLREIARPNRFVMIEAWRDRAAADGWSADRAALSAELEADMIGGFDPRLHTEVSGISVTPPADDPVYLVAHVDVFPPAMGRGVDLVGAEVAAARSDRGNLASGALRWDGHPNHLTLVSVWQDLEAAEAGLTTSHTRRFRAELAPIEGAPHDARLHSAWPEAASGPGPSPGAGLRRQGSEAS